MIRCVLRTVSDHEQVQQVNAATQKHLIITVFTHCYGAQVIFCAADLILVFGLVKLSNY